MKSPKKIKKGVMPLSTFYHNRGNEVIRDTYFGDKKDSSKVMCIVPEEVWGNIYASRVAQWIAERCNMQIIRGLDHPAPETKEK